MDKNKAMVQGDETQRRLENSRCDEVGICGGEGVVHQQPVPTLRQQPLHAELQLGAGGGLEVPQAGGALRVGATESHGAAGHHLLVAVAVLSRGKDAKETVSYKLDFDCVQRCCATVVGWLEFMFGATSAFN